MSDCPYARVIVGCDNYSVICTLKESGGCGCVEDPDTGYCETCPEDDDEPPPVHSEIGNALLHLAGLVVYAASVTVFTFSIYLWGI